MLRKFIIFNHIFITRSKRITLFIEYQIMTLINNIEIQGMYSFEIGTHAMIYVL